MEKGKRFAGRGEETSAEKKEKRGYDFEKANENKKLDLQERDNANRRARRFEPFRESSWKEGTRIPMKRQKLKYARREGNILHENDRPEIGKVRSQRQLL